MKRWLSTRSPISTRSKDKKTDQTKTTLRPSVRIPISQRQRHKVIKQEVTSTDQYTETEFSSDSDTKSDTMTEAEIKLGERIHELKERLAEADKVNAQQVEQLGGLRVEADKVGQLQNQLDVLRAEKQEEDEKQEGIAKVFAAQGNAKARLSRDIKRIGECDGLDATKTLKWVRRVSETQEPLEVARATAEGPLAKTVVAEEDWDELKQIVLTKHVSPVFPLQQREKLAKLKQGKQNWLAYNEEFEQIVLEAYPDGLPKDQLPLVKAYVNGLTNDTVGFEILKREPDTLQEAKDIAQAHQKFSALMGGAKSNVSVEQKANSDLSQIAKGLESLLQSQHDLEKKVNECAAPAKTPKASHDRPKSTQKNVQAPQARDNQNRASFTCYRCGKPGHIARYCRAPAQAPNVASPQQKYQQLPPPNQYNQQVQNQRQQRTSMSNDKCARCRRPDHTVQNCQAPAPRRNCFCGKPHWVYDCPGRRNGQSQSQNLN